VYSSLDWLRTAEYTLLLLLLILLIKKFFPPELVRKYGELVKPGGTWEQSGVVLLFYQINYAASLVKIRADFRNNYPLYIQAWTALGIVNGSRQCELNNQWHYRSNRIGVATVSRCDHFE